MSRIADGFLDELEKLGGLARMAGGALKGVGGVIARSPMKALGVGMIAVPTVMAYRAAKAQGMEEGAGARYLNASRDQPSQAAYTNFHDMIEHKPTTREARAVSKNYKPETFRRASTASKEK